MSNDEAVTKDLVETLEDGREGFRKAAEKLADSNQPQLATTMTELSSQRERFSKELTGLAAAYGDKVEESGSITATLHRGWMAAKDLFSGSDAKGVLDAAVQGEDHAIKEYEKALDDDISPGLREVVARQFTDVKAARDKVKALQVS